MRAGRFCRSVAVGLGQNPDTVCAAGQDTRVPTGTEVVAVHTYQTLTRKIKYISLTPVTQVEIIVEEGIAILANQHIGRIAELVRNNFV